MFFSADTSARKKMKLVVVARGGLEVLFDGEKRREIQVEVSGMGGLDDMGEGDGDKPKTPL